MTIQALSVEEFVDAVRRAVEHIFNDPRYDIAVTHVEMELQLVRTLAGSAGPKWWLLTASAGHTDVQTQTLNLQWAQREVRTARLTRDSDDITQSLIDGLSAADLGLAAWTDDALPFTFQSGLLTLDLAVTTDGKIEVAVLSGSGSSKSTQTVKLTFGPRPQG